jgi:TonB family protein
MGVRAVKKMGFCSILMIAGFLQWSAAAQTANETAAWEPIKGSATAEQLKAFLDAYPDGAFAAEARKKYSAEAKTMLAPLMDDFEIVFPNEARRVGRSIGAMRTVTLDILVRPDGTAGDVDIATASGFDLYDRTAATAARRATYLPAVDNGMPVEARMTYAVSFGLLCNRATGNSTCDNRRFPQTCSATVCALLLR